MEGCRKSGDFATMTDRRSRLALLCVGPGKSAQVVFKAIARALKSYSGHPVQTITSDNGKEFAEREHLATSLNTKTYFANLCSSWERGSNDSINGLIRQYFPKGTDFKTITLAALAHTERNLNNRPGK